jgi:NAD+ synthase (glutamine-hydrolysing)
VDELAEATRAIAHRSAGGRGFAGGGGRASRRECGRSAGWRRLLLEQHKRLLPFYDVFDEQRYFAPAQQQQVVELDGVRLAITICEDAWNDKNFWPRRLYKVDPMEELMRQHPAVHINLSSSPFWHGKRAIRREMLAAIARRDGVPVLM